MKLEDFNYVLPKELIAQQPAEPRDSCRLLMVDKKTGEWQHRRFRDILDEIRPGDVFVFNNTKVIHKTEFGGRLVKFHYSGDFDNWLDQLGEMPTPPYIHKKLENKDEYQTVYAKFKGSAAAPTAGLHFTPELLEKMKDKGAELLFVKLHVGIGPFRPVADENIEVYY